MGGFKFPTSTIISGGALLIIAGCTHSPPPPPPPEPAPEPAPAPMAPRGQIEADSTVNVSRNANGGFDFRYSGNDVDPKGNMQFDDNKGRGNEVLIKICVDDATYENGIRFVQKSKDDAAMWIELSELLPPGASPTGPYDGDQFYAFATTQNGRCMQVVDKNDDGLVYTYALRFRVPGEKNPVQHDPVIRNGE